MKRTILLCGKVGNDAHYNEDQFYITLIIEGDYADVKLCIYHYHKGYGNGDEVDINKGDIKKMIKNTELLLNNINNNDDIELDIINKVTAYTHYSGMYPTEYSNFNISARKEGNKLYLSFGDVSNILVCRKIFKELYVSLNKYLDIKGQ